MSDYFIGASVDEVDTPVLIVYLDVLERNIEYAAELFAESDVKWRPHIKGQKVPAIAHKEVAAGAIGVTCAKLGEAEVMVYSGIDSVLIANQIVGTSKLKRLANLCAQAEVITAVDDEANVKNMAKAGKGKGLDIPVIVEVDIGMKRCGVQPGQPVLQLSQQIAELEGVTFKGIMGWEGHARRYKDCSERKQVCRQAIKMLVESARICRESGLDVEIVSCGGTGTHQFSRQYSEVTEIQAGGIIFNDMYYSSLGLDREYALAVLSTVTSRPQQNRIVTDAGKKTMSSDTAMPEPRGVKDVESISFSAEHGVITTTSPNTDLNIGDTLEWIVGYGDTTVALHDEVYGVREGQIEVIWPILARGKVR